MPEQQYDLNPGESKQGSEASPKNVGTKWLWFYTYIGLPFSILLVIMYLGGLPTIVFDKLSSLPSHLVLGFIILLISTASGLRKRKLWAYVLNWLVLIVECLAFPFSQTSAYILEEWLAYPFSQNISALFNFALAYIFMAILFGLVWFLPNAMYFKKRKHLFI